MSARPMRLGVGVELQVYGPLEYSGNNQGTLCFARSFPTFSLSQPTTTTTKTRGKFVEEGEGKKRKKKFEVNEANRS